MTTQPFSHNFLRKTIERILVDPLHLTETKLGHTDVMIILDNCVSDNVIRATLSKEQNVELLAAVIADQHAFGNPSDSARILNRTFTARLVGDVAIRRGRQEKSLVLSDVMAELRSQSNAERLSVLETVARSKAIRLAFEAPNWKRTFTIPTTMGGFEILGILGIILFNER